MKFVSAVKCVRASSRTCVRVHVGVGWRSCGTPQRCAQQRRGFIQKFRIDQPGAYIPRNFVLSSDAVFCVCVCACMCSVSLSFRSPSGVVICDMIVGCWKFRKNICAYCADFCSSYNNDAFLFVSSLVAVSVSVALNSVFKNVI